MSQTMLPRHFGSRKPRPLHSKDSTIKLHAKRKREVGEIPCASKVLCVREEDKAQPATIPDVCTSEPAARRLFKSLPEVFADLLYFFERFDHVLQFARIRKQQTLFVKLQHTFQQTVQRTFTVTHLAQFLYVLPSCYVVRWIKQQGSREYTLLIDFPLEACEGLPSDPSLLEPITPYIPLSEARMHERRTKFESVLVAWSSSSEGAEETCTRILKQAQLPLRPEAPKGETVSEFLAKGVQAQTLRLQKALEETGVCELVSTTVAAETSSVPLAPAVRGIPTSVLEKVRARERQAIQERTAGLSESTERRRALARLPELCDKLRSYFLSRKKSVIPLEEVCKTMQTSSLHPVSIETVGQQIQAVADMATSWCSLRTVSERRFLVIDGKADYYQIRQQLTTVIKQQLAL